jgi:hypothetical protein
MVLAKVSLAEELNRFPIIHPVHKSIQKDHRPYYKPKVLKSPEENIENALQSKQKDMNFLNRAVIT